LESLILHFTEYLQFEKRYSDYTVRSYRDDLQAFNTFLFGQYGNLPIGEISPGFVRSWLASQKNAGISSRSINRRISVLKSFFKYLMKTGQAETSPMGSINSPKMSKRLPVYVEKKDILRLLSRIEFPDDWQGRTDRLLIAIFYNTGMRLSELVYLKEGQIDFSNSNIKVLGKGNKERLIPMSDSLSDAIRKYMQEKEDRITGDKTVCLLTNGKGERLYPKSVYLSVKKYLSIVTTLEKKSPHVLRHSFATHLTDGGAELNSVKELLGHSSLAATQVYTHNSIEKLKDVYRKAHPKA
jgi:integrase/recombinase XerC